MKYLAISRSAAEEMISDRFLQSAEFESGLSLSLFLRGDARSAALSSRLRMVPAVEGSFILTRSDVSRHYAIFDVEGSGIFQSKFKNSDILLHLQKTLRFCAKMWANLKPSSNERFLVTSTKAVIFPYPISQQTSLRISLELAPDSKRSTRRGDAGRFVLVYRCSTDEGGGPHEEVRLTNFRKFREALPEIVQLEPARDDGALSITSLAVTSLDEQPAARLDAFQGFQRWLQLLTSKQKEFVEAELQMPHRIEGPAGTGKTLSLILKSLSTLKKAEADGKEHRSLFVAHSDATRRTIQQIIEVNDERSYLAGEDRLRPQSLKLTTLHQLCGDLLRQDISETEFLDRDAMESKQVQLLYINEAITRAMADDFETHRRFLSDEFQGFVLSSDAWVFSEMVQHEISVVIKGRSEEKLDNYRKTPRLLYGIPIRNAGDRGFLWMIFRKYQEQLQESAQFDTDDIVLTTTGQLNTPIWRRRRLREGYDSIFIDETHLFNLNELSLFHHLPRKDDHYPIAYSVDLSQAIGDRGWTDHNFESALSPDSAHTTRSSRTQMAGVFRCSPEIVNLAFSVTSAGATLFTNFNNPLDLAASMFTAAEERKCALPVTWVCANDEEIVDAAFARAERITREMEVSRSGLVMIAFSDELFGKASDYVKQNNKPVEFLRERGDYEIVQKAQQAGRFLLTTPDYVGGLEFDAVLLLGVDEGRVPPTYTADSADSRNFLSYASHNRLYVSITRARYRVEVLASKERGTSPLLRNALRNGLLGERPVEIE